MKVQFPGGASDPGSWILAVPRRTALLRAYTTITMHDLENGTQQDEFVSEHASRLYPRDCADDVITGLNDFDTSGYFYNGFFRNHYGAVRSDAGIAKVIAALERN